MLAKVFVLNTVFANNSKWFIILSIHWFLSKKMSFVILKTMFTQCLSFVDFKDHRLHHNLEKKIWKKRIMSGRVKESYERKSCFKENAYESGSMTEKRVIQAKTAKRTIVWEIIGHFTSYQLCP